MKISEWKNIFLYSKDVWCLERVPRATQTILKKSVHYRRKDDSGCESDVSSNNSSDDTPLGLPRNKRRKKYTKNKGCDIAAIR